MSMLLSLYECLDYILWTAQWVPADTVARVVGQLEHLLLNSFH